MHVYVKKIDQSAFITYWNNGPSDFLRKTFEKLSRFDEKYAINPTDHDTTMHWYYALVSECQQRLLAEGWDRIQILTHREWMKKLSDELFQKIDAPDYNSYSMLSKRSKPNSQIDINAYFYRDLMMETDKYNTLDQYIDDVIFMENFANNLKSVFEKWRSAYNSYTEMMMIFAEFFAIDDLDVNTDYVISVLNTSVFQQLYEKDSNMISRKKDPRVYLSNIIRYPPKKDPFNFEKIREVVGFFAIYDSIYQVSPYVTHELAMRFFSNWGYHKKTINSFFGEDYQWNI